MKENHTIRDTDVAMFKFKVLPIEILMIAKMTDESLIK